MKGSSCERAIRVSNTMVFSPWAVEPAFRLKGFRLSKVPSRHRRKPAALRRRRDRHRGNARNRRAGPARRASRWRSAARARAAAGPCRRGTRRDQRGGGAGRQGMRADGGMDPDCDHGPILHARCWCGCDVWASPRRTACNRRRDHRQRRRSRWPDNVSPHSAAMRVPRRQRPTRRTRLARSRETHRRCACVRADRSTAVAARRPSARGASRASPRGGAARRAGRRIRTRIPTIPPYTRRGHPMPIQPMKLGTAALLAAAAAGRPGARPQTAAPAAPAPEPPPQGQPQNPNAPVKIDMQTVPKTDWTKVCSKPQAGQKELCFTTRDFTTAPDQPPPVALAVYDVKGDDSRIVRAAAADRPAAEARRALLGRQGRDRRRRLRVLHAERLLRRRPRSTARCSTR